MIIIDYELKELHTKNFGRTAFLICRLGKRENWSENRVARASSQRTERCARGDERGRIFNAFSPGQR